MKIKYLKKKKDTLEFRGYGLLSPCKCVCRQMTQKFFGQTKKKEINFVFDE